jgi:hypothetical protein
MHDGDRVLTDPEWDVFAAGLDLLRDAVEEDIAAGADDASTGVPVFDRLTPEQKLGLLAEVALALRDPAVPMPPHTAANEGAIMAVFWTVRSELEAELDDARMEAGDPPTEIRRLLRAACDDAGDREDSLPDPHDADPGGWAELAEEVEGRVFWDTDFAMGDEFLDLPPGESRALLERAGIDPDYFLTVLPDPGEAGLTAARQTLARLLGRPVPGDDGLYPTLVDLYHDLTVGPVSPDEAAAWDDHPWVQVVGSTEPGWHCDYETWEGEFSRVVPAEPFEVDPAAGGAAAGLPAGVRVERRGDWWVVRADDGSYWCDPTDNGWADDPDDEDLPALAYPTETDARSAYAQADRMYGERAERRAAALARLGRSV